MHTEGSDAAHSQLVARLQTWPYCATLVAVYTLIVGFVSLLIVEAEWSPGLLVLFSIPSMLAAVYFRRRIYLSMQVLQFGASLLVVGVLSPDARPEFVAVLAYALTSAVVTEALHALIAARRRVEAELRERERFLTHLYDITRTTLTTDDVPAMLQELANRLGELFGADSCYIALWNEDRQAVVPTVAYGAARERYATLVPEPGEVTMTQSVLQARRPLVVDDVYNTPYLSPRVAALFSDRSLLGLPLLAGSQELGATLVGFTSPHRFTPDEVRRGEQVANQIALAVAKARLVASLRRYATELESRNAELDAFAHTVAHDLKLPLSTTLGFSELLVEEAESLGNEERGRWAASIARSSRKMANIVDELLLLAVLRDTAPVKSGPLAMGEVVAGACERLGSVCAERQAEIQVQEAWPVAIGYGPWIEEVWVNYLSNAILYGGVPPRVVAGGEPQGDGYARFWVRDNGAGIAPEARERLFTPFTRLDRAHPTGHGLGLSIARRIVERHGGQVGVESIPGDGSLFWFTLRAEEAL